MNAFCGIWHTDGRPVDGGALNALTLELERRGPDGGHQLIAGPLGLASRSFHTTPDSREAVLPLSGPRGNLLCWDGRLDNRDELRRALHRGRHETRGCSDASLVMEAYSAWGTSCFQRLTGDFAIALWEAGQRRLILARDPFGARPLYYRVSANSVAFASEIQPLLRIASERLSLDQDYIAGYLMYDPDPTLTPYREIRSVEPGTCLCAGAGANWSYRHWAPDVAREIRFKTDAEYEEAFLEKLRRAVAARLRAESPVWADLSGGLDSSSIVCLADNLAASSVSPNGRLETVSFAYEESPTSDESKFVGYVEEHRGMETHFITEREQAILKPLTDDDLPPKPSVMLLFNGLYRCLERLLRQAGARVLLCGIGGDHMLWSEPAGSPEIADLIARLRLGQAHRLTAAWSRAEAAPYLSTLAIYGVAPLLPRVHRLLMSKKVIPQWVDQGFARRTEMRQRMPLWLDPYGYKAPSERAQSGMLTGAIYNVSAGYLRDRMCIEPRYPYLDRGLVEFLLAIPIGQKIRPGEKRSVMRRALKGILPEKTRTRRGKRGPDEAFYRALVREWEHVASLFKQPRVCEYGIAASRAAVESAVLTAKLFQPDTGLSTAKLLSLELWLRAVEPLGLKIT